MSDQSEDSLFAGSLTELLPRNVAPQTDPWEQREVEVYAFILPYVRDQPAALNALRRTVHLPDAERREALRKIMEMACEAAGEVLSGLPSPPAPQKPVGWLPEGLRDANSVLAWARDILAQFPGKHSGLLDVSVAEDCLAVLDGSNGREPNATEVLSAAVRLGQAIGRLSARCYEPEVRAKRLQRVKNRQNARKMRNTPEQIAKALELYDGLSGSNLKENGKLARVSRELNNLGIKMSADTVARRVKESRA